MMDLFEYASKQRGDILSLVVELIDMVSDLPLDKKVDALNAIPYTIRSYHSRGQWIQ